MDFLLSAAYDLIVFRTFLYAGGFARWAAVKLDVTNQWSVATRTDIALLPTMAVARLLKTLLHHCRYAPCDYQAIRQQGYEVCRRCGYWLRGLDPDTKHCPECGTKRELLSAANPSADA